jgi:hypothetical protein
VESTFGGNGMPKIGWSSLSPIHNPAVKIRIQFSQALWPVAKSGDHRVIAMADVHRRRPSRVSRPRCGNDLQRQGESLATPRWSLARVPGIGATRGSSPHSALNSRLSHNLSLLGLWRVATS